MCISESRVSLESQHGSCVANETVDWTLSHRQPMEDAENSNMSDTVDFTQAFDPINSAGVWEALLNVCFLETFINVTSHSTKPLLIPPLPEVLAPPSELNIHHYLLPPFGVTYLLVCISKLYLLC